MRQFHFLRHGQTDWNVEKRMQGRADIPLNENGIAQAQAAAEHYTDYSIDRIISSPQQRAHVTAQHVAERLGVPLELDTRLIERCCGTLEGLTQEEIAASDPAVLYDPTIANDWYGDRPMPKGGETREQVADRAHSAVMEHLTRYPAETILFVAHGAWFRALVHRLGGGYIHSDNATPYIFTPNGDDWLIEAVTPSGPSA